MTGTHSPSRPQSRPRPRPRPRQRSPRLPEPRGPLSAAVTALLRESPRTGVPVPSPDDCHAYGDDLQLALYLLYELHYQGFDRTSPTASSGTAVCWPAAARSRTASWAHCAQDVPMARTDTAERALDELQLEPAGNDGTSVSHHPPATKATSASCASTRRCARSTTSRRRTRTPGSSPGCTGGPRRRWWRWSSTSSARAVRRRSSAELFADLMADLGAGHGVRALPRRGPGRGARHRQPDVPARPAPSAARRARRPLRRRRGDLAPGLPPPRRGHAARRRRTGGRTVLRPSTSRPTRCTSRSYDTTSSGASWRANRAWRPT